MRRLAFLSVIALLFQGLYAAAPASESAPRFRTPVVSSGRITQSRDDVLRFWTKERMAKAKPLLPEIGAGRLPSASSEQPSGKPVVIAPASPAREYSDSDLSAYSGGSIPYERQEVTDPAAETVRAHGKVFFTDGTSIFVCSGTVVNSAALNVVWTAGHCVFDPQSGDFMTNWIFVPGYRQGNSPYGRFTATQLFTTSGWMQTANFEVDFGAAVVGAVDGSQVQTVVGARGIAFNLPAEQTWNAFGYPANPADGFDGEREYVCISDTGGRAEYGPPTDNLILIGCDMTQGSSGGGWVINGATVNSVVSAGSDQVPEVIFGPYQGSAAQSVYNQAALGTDPGPQVVTHNMRLTLKLKTGGRKLVMKGKLSAGDGFAACAAGAPVVLGKVISPTSARVLKTVTTTSTGAYSGKVAKKKGRYVALSPEGSVDELNLCSAAQSPVRRFS